MQADNANRPKLIERINNATSSANIRIPAADVSLFNDAARSGSTNLGQPPGANGVNAPNPEPTDTDFREVQRVHEIDSHELNLCRQAVIDWNQMWDGFTANVKATERVNP
jgi:hypothetical protein